MFQWQKRATVQRLHWIFWIKSVNYKNWETLIVFQRLCEWCWRQLFSLWRSKWSWGLRVRVPLFQKVVQCTFYNNTHFPQLPGQITPLKCSHSLNTLSCICYGSVFLESKLQITEAQQLFTDFDTSSTDLLGGFYSDFMTNLEHQKINLLLTKYFNNIHFVGLFIICCNWLLISYACSHHSINTANYILISSNA